MALRSFVRTKVDAWLRKHIPPAEKITLNQNKIFIFPTRYGHFFIVMLIALFLGGVNYSNSLILGFTFWLTGVFIISILYAFRNLSGLIVEASKAQACFAGERAGFEINLSRSGKRVYEAVNLFWENGARGRCDLVDVKENTVLMLLPTDRRGWYRPGRLKIESVFPLGLVRAWSWVELEMQCLVFPKPIKNDSRNLFNAGSQEGKFCREAGVDDFEGLKLYRPGDPLKHVHWKTLARGQELHSKTFVRSVDQTFMLNWHQFPLAEVEIKLSYLCYWVLRLTERDQTFGMSLPGIEIKPGKGAEHKYQCLTALAAFKG